MPDPAALVMSALALLGTLPNYVKSWQDFVVRKREQVEPPNEQELREFHEVFLAAQADYLLHKKLLLALILWFSKEHFVSEDITRHCTEQLRVTEEQITDLHALLSERRDQCGRTRGGATR